MITRRALLAAAAALTAACAAPPRQVPTPPTAPPPTTSGTAPPVQVRRALSGARGTDVRVVVVTPGDVPAATLPVCLVLHGSGDTADVLVDLGAPAALAAAATPFALVAVDGGDSGWQPVPGDDPTAMLTGELPRWLAQAGLATTPFALLGFGDAAPATLDRVLRTSPIAAALVDPVFEQTPTGAERLRTTALAIWSGPYRAAEDLATTAGADLRPLDGTPMRDVVAFLADHARTVRGGY